jgi:fucose permease
MGGQPLRQRASVTATFASHGLLFASWAAHIPQFKARLELSDPGLGLVLLATPVGSVLAMIVAGRLLGRLGSRPIVRVALAGYCLAGPAVGLSHAPWALFVTLLAWGAFQGALDVSMNTQAIAVQRRQARTLMPGFHGAWSVGAFAGAGAGTLGVALGVSLTAQLLALDVPVAAAALALHGAMIADATGPGPGSRSDRRGPARLLSGALALLAVTAFASMFCEGAAADWSAVYLRGPLHFSPGLAGLGYAVFSLLMLSVRLSGNHLIERVAQRRLLPALAVAATIVFGLGLAVQGTVVVLVAFGCLGAGLALVIPSVFTAAGDLRGLSAGAGVAAVSACGWAGFVCGPPVIGQLAGAAGIRDALITVPVLTALIAVATARLRAQ